MSRILLFLFGLSGASALIYEIVWARELVLIFGASVYAISTVLAVFFAGLALGSVIFGRIVDRYKNPLLLYALLEVGIGVYAFFTPWIFQLTQGFQISLGNLFGLQEFSEWSFLRFILSFFALIIPTTLIGGTLPVIIKYFSHNLERFGNITAKLYSINTFGAVFGAILAGFFLILWFGVTGAIYFAAAINILIAGVVFFIQIGEKEYSLPEYEMQISPKNGIGGLKLPLILSGFFVSGFSAIALEVLWTRALILTIGISTYAFSIVLITFLLGIALGSLIISRFIDKINAWNMFAKLEILRGISVILLIPIFGILPFWYIFIIKNLGWSFEAGTSTSFIITILVLLVPTLLMGATFPVVAKIVTREFKKLGFSVGRAYLFNTLGGVGGALAAGFFLIPLFGVQKSIVFASALYLIVGLVLTLFSKTHKIFYKVTVAIIVIGVFVGGMMLPDWNRAVLQSRVFARAPVYFEQSVKEMKEEIENIKLLSYKEGISSLVAIKRDSTQVVLLINGKPQSASEGDKEPQLLLGHLPMLLHENPKKALVIGLGGGMTLGAIEQYSELEKVTVVEIEPEVVKAGSYFAHTNNDALNDPRLEVVIGDGRNYLLTTKETFDVISSEPSNPWIKGLANLYTKEFFQLAKQRLNEEGIMIQWMQISSVQKEDLQSFIATFQSVFPHVSMWESMTSLFIIGSESEVNTFDIAKINDRFEQTSVAKDLSRIDIKDAPALFSHFVASDGAVKELSYDLSLHTDNNPFLEFSSPKSFYNTLNHFLENLEFLNSIRVPVNDFTDLISKQTQSEIQKYFNSRTDLIETKLRNNYALLANDFELEENYPKAEKYYKKLINLLPENSLTWQGLGAFYAKRSRFNEAKDAFLKSLELDPDNFETHISLGSTYRAIGDIGKAIVSYRKALEINPNNEEIREIILQLEGR